MASLGDFRKASAASVASLVSEKKKKGGLQNREAIKGGKSGRFAIRKRNLSILK
jgi:hypothetical protein